MLHAQLSDAAFSTNNLFFFSKNNICIPLNHFSSTLNILSMIIRASDTIFIDMGQLQLNPCR